MIDAHGVALALRLEAPCEELVHVAPPRIVRAAIPPPPGLTGFEDGVAPPVEDGPPEFAHPGQDRTESVVDPIVVWREGGGHEDLHALENLDHLQAHALAPDRVGDLEGDLEQTGRPEFMGRPGRSGAPGGDGPLQAVPEVPGPGHHRPLGLVLEGHFGAWESTPWPASR